MKLLYSVLLACLSSISLASATPIFKVKCPEIVFIDHTKQVDFLCNVKNTSGNDMPYLYIDFMGDHSFATLEFSDKSTCKSKSLLKKDEECNIVVTASTEYLYKINYDVYLRVCGFNGLVCSRSYIIGLFLN